MNYQWLNNQQILKYIDTLPVQTKYINLIVLDNYNRPLRAIQGRATGGSININGNSPVRRSGSISLITDYDKEAEGLDVMHRISDVSSLLSLNKRMSIEIGIINSGVEYADFPIFWFPLGIFLFSNASVQSDSSGIQINLTLTDKMGLLNGEVGGEFSSLEQLSPIDGEDQLFYDILYHILTQVGHLSSEEILIEDVPKTIQVPATYTTVEDGINKTKQLSALTAFTYPAAEKCIAQPGDTVMTVLEKLKNHLNTHEYFFDINGIFHFRQIKDYTLQGSASKSLVAAAADKIHQYLMYSAGEKYTYSFEQDSPLVIAYQNTPAYSKLKNDFHIWGQVPETKYPIHYHLLLSDVVEKSHVYYPESLIGYEENRIEADKCGRYLKQLYSKSSGDYYYQAYHPDGNISIATKPSGVWIGRDVDDNAKSAYKTNGYCSSAEFIDNEYNYVLSEPRNLTYYQMSLPESCQMNWDGADIYTRFYICPQYQQPTDGDAAQVLWSRADPRKFGILPTDVSGVRDPWLNGVWRDDVGSGSITEGADEQQIELKGNFMVCRVRFSSPRQKMYIKTCIAPKQTYNTFTKADYNVTTGYNHYVAGAWYNKQSDENKKKILKSVSRIDTILDLEEFQTDAMKWHTFVIDLSSYSSVHNNNFITGWTKDTKDVITLMLHFPWPKLTDQTILRETMNYIDLDFIAFPNYTRGDSLLTKIKKLYPNDYIVHINAEGSNVIQEASTYAKPLTVHWANYMKAEAWYKNKHGLQLEPHERELLSHKFTLNNTNIQWDEASTYCLDLLDISQLEKDSKLRNYIAAYAVENIGLRTKAISNEKINCLTESDYSKIIMVTFPEALQLSIMKDAASNKWMFARGDSLITLTSQMLDQTVYPPSPEEDPEYTGLTVADINSIFEHGFFISVDGSEPEKIYDFKQNIQYYCLTLVEAHTAQLHSHEVSAMSELRSVLHEYLSYNNRINLTTIPIYHLDANQRINVECEEADIHGDYIIESINLPLDFNSPMSISARQVMERI